MEAESMEMEIDDDRPSLPASLGRLTGLTGLPPRTLRDFIPSPPESAGAPPYRQTSTRDTHSRADVGARGCVNVEGERKPSR